MSFFKRIFQGESGRFAIYAIVIVAVFLLILLFGKGNNLINWIQVRHEVSQQEREIKTLKDEIEKMGEELELLQTDKDYLEEFARENYHFSAPGEDVYVLDE